MPHTGLSIADTCSFDEARSTMGSGLRSIETTPGYQAGDGLNSINTSQGVSIPHINGGFKLLAGSSPFPLACAYTAPHLNQASPLVTNTAGDCLASRYCYRRTTIPMRVNPRLSGVPANPIMTQKGRRHRLADAVNGGKLYLKTPDCPLTPYSSLYTLACAPGIHQAPRKTELISTETRYSLLICIKHIHLIPRKIDHLLVAGPVTSEHSTTWFAG